MQNCLRGAFLSRSAYAVAYAEVAVRIIWRWWCWRRGMKLVTGGAQCSSLTPFSPPARWVRVAAYPPSSAVLLLVLLANPLRQVSRQSSSPSFSPILFASSGSQWAPLDLNRRTECRNMPKSKVILVAAPWTSFGWAKGPQFHLGPTRFLRESLRGAYAKVRSEMDFLKTSHCHQSLLFCELISKQKEYSARTASGYNVKCLSINPLFL